MNHLKKLYNTLVQSCRTTVRDATKKISTLGSTRCSRSRVSLGLSSNGYRRRCHREKVDVYHAPENKFERFRWFLELICRFEFDFRRPGNYFLKDSNFWCVQSSNTHTHTQCGCPCACAVACLHPHNSISNFVVSLTIHDNLKYIFIHM